MYDNTLRTDDPTAEPRGRPLRASWQIDEIKRQSVVMVGTIAEVLPEFDESDRPKSDADLLLRMIPGGLMTGVRRAPEPAGHTWDPVIWLDLSHPDGCVKVRSGEFREYLAALFMTETGRVLKAERREEVIVALGGLIALAWAERRELENGRGHKLRAASNPPADDEIEQIDPAGSTTLKSWARSDATLA